MSKQNVEVVRRAVEFEFSGRGGRAEAAAIFDPSFVMNPLEEEPAYGLDAIRDNIEHWTTAWDQLEVTAEEFIDAGDRVVVVLHHRGRGRGSGIEIDARFYELYTLRDGKVLRADEYAERAEALEAAGLSE